MVDKVDCISFTADQDEALLIEGNFASGSIKLNGKVVTPDADGGIMLAAGTEYLLELNHSAATQLEYTLSFTPSLMD